MQVSQQRYADALVLTPAGRIDNSTTDALRADLNTHLVTCRSEGDRLVLDFSAVDYINSTGIALIVGVLAQARTSGQDVQARGLAEHYREIFRITRLSDFMTILDEEGTE